MESSSTKMSPGAENEIKEFNGLLVRLEQQITYKHDTDVPDVSCAFESQDKRQAKEEELLVPVSSDFPTDLETAKKLFDDMVSELDSMCEDSYKDKTLKLQELRDFIDLGTCQEDRDILTGHTGEQTEIGLRLIEMEKIESRKKPTLQHNALFGFKTNKSVSKRKCTNKSDRPYEVQSTPHSKQPVAMAIHPAQKKMPQKFDPQMLSGAGMFSYFESNQPIELQLDEFEPMAYLPPSPPLYTNQISPPGMCLDAFALRYPLLDDDDEKVSDVENTIEIKPEINPAVIAKSMEEISAEIFGMQSPEGSWSISDLSAIRQFLQLSPEQIQTEIEESGAKSLGISVYTQLLQFIPTLLLLLFLHTAYPQSFEMSPYFISWSLIPSRWRSPGDKALSFLRNFNKHNPSLSSRLDLATSWMQYAEKRIDVNPNK